MIKIAQGLLSCVIIATHTIFVNVHDKSIFVAEPITTIEMGEQYYNEKCLNI